jgi:hypothetical protein
MRFEIVSAFAIGVLLPFLETYRRGLDHWSIDFTTMFEDYAGGILLLIGGWASYRKWRWGRLFLLAIWAGVTGMMSISFVSQLEDTIRGNVQEQNNAMVVLVKSLLWGIALVSLISSFRGIFITLPRDH